MEKFSPVTFVTFTSLFVLFLLSSLSISVEGGTTTTTVLPSTSSKSTESVSYSSTSPAPENEEKIESSQSQSQALSLTSVVDRVTTALLPDKSQGRDFGVTLLTSLAVGALLLLPILGIVFILLFIPLPAIYFPMGTLPGVNNSVLVTGRQEMNFPLFDNFKLNPETVGQLRGMMDSDVCVQRISCEIMRASKGLSLDKWLSGMMNDIPVSYDLKWKINRATQATRNCKRFLCDPMSSIWKMFTT